MSSEVHTTGAELVEARDGPAENVPRARRRLLVRRAHGPISRWWVRAHRWAALALGLLFVLEATTGAVALYGNDIARAVHPERYTVTPSAAPMSQLDALRMVQASHPELHAASVQDYRGVYLVRGPAKSREFTDAFVDPGTGRINGIGAEMPSPVLFLINVHACALACEGLPGYQGLLATPLPGFLGRDMIVGDYLLGVLGVLVIFLSISGAIIWWPGLRTPLAGFVLRRGRGNYVRDLDLHRLVGIIAAPFLLMWGVTGAAFFFHWPEQVYFALVPGQAHAEAAEPTPGTGSMLSIEQARDVALALHPDAEVVGFLPQDPQRPGGSYRFRLRQGFDPYRHWNYAGNRSVTVDSHGGGTQDSAPARDGPATERLWYEGVYFGLHFGSVVSGWPRVVWLLFGLTPVLLGITGATVWLTKRRSRRNRKRRRRASASPGA